MFRILGFIIGSAISIAGIFFVMGTPEIHLSGVESKQARFDAALQQIREKQHVPGPVLDEPPATEAASDSEIAALEPLDEDLPAENMPLEAVTEPLADPPDIFNPQLQWYAFWNPFRSELAAQGFVSRLEKVTGLDYRVVKIEAGVYEVGFAYSDDDERRFKISQISAATGLDLPQT